MNISNYARARKLFWNLLSNPDLIIPYWSTSLVPALVGGQLPIDFGMPWWSFRAIEYADNLLDGKRIFEFGTGGSTWRYARVAKKVTCVEDNVHWLDIVRLRLLKSGITNVTLIHREFDFDHPVNFKSSSYLNTYDPSEEFDVVIIDGQDKTFRERIDCFKFVEPTMRSGGLIILDDWWRYIELLDLNRAKSVKVCESVGPCRLGVTSTAFFHY